jgi:hypothetical protein
MNRLPTGYLISDRLSRWGSASHHYRESDVPMAQPQDYDEALRQALARQCEPGAHDRGLIVERLAWTPEERLEANARFLRFYLSVRPEGPLLPD